MTRLLIIIPAYNEAERIAATLGAYAGFFAERMGEACRIHVVLNGCRDNTREVVEATARQHPAIEFSEFPERIGKGGALIEGLRYARGCEFIGYVDADGATPPHAFWDLYQACQNAQAVIGSRWIPGAKIHRLQSMRRRFASRCFHLLVSTLFWMRIRDTQCGAKVFRSDAILKIHDQLLISDMSFDVNLLVALHRAGIPIREIPTEWTDQSGSTVRLVRTSLRMLFSVLRLRVIYSPLNPIRLRLQKLEHWLYKKL